MALPWNLGYGPFRVPLVIEKWLWSIINKCIGDDTKAAARQSLNCIKNKKKICKKRFSIWQMEFLHPAMWRITTLILSGHCTVQCGMWLWNHDSQFTKWQHPAMWYVALGWHAIEFAQTSAILEFYIWFPFPHITAVDMSFCTMAVWHGFKKPRFLGFLHFGDRETNGQTDGHHQCVKPPSRCRQLRHNKYISQ